MQTLPLYQTTGISGFKIVRIRTKACQGFGRMKAMIEADIHRTYCPDCKALTYEHLEFLANPRSRVTRSFGLDIVSQAVRIKSREL